MAVKAVRRTCPACAERARLGLARLELTLGFEVIEWAEEMLVHGPGDVQGQPLELDDEFRHVLLHIYELSPHGRRVVRRAYLSRPKGRGKTELAGVLAAAELCGPVRCDGFDSRGAPVGVAVTGPQVITYATEENQAGTTYSTAAYMLAEGAAGDAYELDIGLSRTYLGSGGVLLPETSGATSADGARTTFSVFDETHLWVRPELRNLHATVRRNLGKRGGGAEPWSLETSTMYRPGEESVAEVLHRYVERMAAEGLHDGSLYVDHREAPPVDIADDAELELALRTVYGPAADWLDLERIMAEMRDPQSDEADARRYWLNQPARAADAWLEDLQLWLDAAEPERELEEGEPVVLGFDGSLSDDATALVACTVAREGHPHLQLLGCWEPDPDASGPERAGWVVDREAVNAAVADAFERLTVCLAYCDPAYWQPEIAAWASEYGAQVVREFPTGREARMTAAAMALHTSIVAGEVSHDGSATFTRHVRNARSRPNRHGITLRKERPHSPLKIDAAVAACLAHTARSDAVAQNLDKKTRRYRKPGSSQLLYF